MGLDFLKENALALHEALDYYNKLEESKEGKEDSELEYLKSYILKLCTSIKENLETTRKKFLQNATR